MFTSRLKLLIRADAGPNVGSGHVLRMLTLAQVWKQAYGDVAIVVGKLPSLLLDRITELGLVCFPISNDDGDTLDARDVVEVSKVFEPDWTALDGSQFNDSYQRIVSSSNSRLLVLDDASHANHQYADLVLCHNRNVRQDASAIEATRSFRGVISNPGRPEYLSGASYTLLRDDGLQRVDKPRRRIYANARRVLVVFTGSDPDGLAIRTLRIMASLNRSKLIVDCLVGSNHHQMASLAIFKANSDLNIRLHSNLDRLIPLAEKVDLAIATDASSITELVHAGVPTLMLSDVGQRHRIPQWLIKSEAVLPVVSGERIAANGKRDGRILNLEHSLPLLLKKTLSNQTLRRQMSIAGRKLIDGRGGERIASEMVSRCFQLRLATADDANRLFEWRNDPEVCAISFTDKKLSFSAHQEWLRKKLADSKCVLLISEDIDGRAIGQIRFDLLTSETASVSIIIAQELRGQGIGKLLIRRAVSHVFQQLPIDRVLAQVKPTNTPSERAFRHAGFQPIAPTLVDGKVAHQFVFDRKSLMDLAPSAEVGLKKSA